MSHIQKLSTELLLIIISHLPSPELRELSYTCRRLHETAIPNLYHSVFFWGHRKFYGLGNGGFINRQANPPPNATRISNLKAFTRSYRASARLRRYVKNVDIRWHKANNLEDDDIHRCLAILDSSRLQNLHLSPPDFLFDIPAGTPITSLAFQHHGLRGDWYPEEYAEEFDRLYTLLCIPTLTHLCLDGWRHWGPPSYERPAEVRTDRVGTSNIMHLTLNLTGPPGQDLQEMLSWPRALQSFSYSACPYDGLRYEGPSKLSSRELFHVLQQQRHTLENLEVDGADGNTGSDLTKPMTLTNFPALARLCIRADFIVAPSLDYEFDTFTWDPSTMPTCHLTNALPPTLQELKLDALGMIGCYRTGNEEYESHVQDFLSWLLDVADPKVNILPALKSVGYTPSYFFGSEDGRHDARFEEVRRVYGEARIDLYGYDDE